MTSAWNERDRVTIADGIAVCPEVWTFIVVSRLAGAKTANALPAIFV